MDRFDLMTRSRLKEECRALEATCHDVRARLDRVVELAVVSEVVKELRESIRKLDAMAQK